MLIEKKIRNFIVYSGDKILEALRRINDNQSRIIFVVEENGVLIGTITDGDFRRWIIDNNDFNLNQPVDKVMNSQFVVHSINDETNEIAQDFGIEIDIIPLVDDIGRFVAIARKSAEGFQIGKHIISEHSKSFLIAEIGNNHNGDIHLAKRLVDLALEAGADCAKFQMRNLESLYSNKGRNGETNYDLGSQYTLDILNKFQLTHAELFEVFDYSHQQGILPLCTPWDLVSLQALESYGMEAYKVASADFTNFEMLRQLVQTGKPLICSTGMCAESEIKTSVAFLRRLGAQFALLHCISTYPTPFKDVNLNYLSRLKQNAGTVIGYSGHERGYAVPVAAVSLGAKIIEKHFTVDRSMEGNDHKVSLLPEEFAAMVRQIREVEVALGQGSERALTQGELINRENLAKSLVINQPLKKGEIIKREMIIVKSPGQGLQPNRLDDLVGIAAVRDLQPGEFFYETDIVQKTVKKSRYSFSRPYGIPVRYHDFHQLVKDIELDFIEFHLSYHDMEVDPADFFGEQHDIGFAVHCPELFAGDHILDLSSIDESYRSRSIEELKKVVSRAVQLQKYFVKTAKPVLILNAGGWSLADFLPTEKRRGVYDRIIDSLGQIDFSPVKLAIQNMPPFPWHFGGQRYHNVFVDPDEICDLCEQTEYHICLDVSHAMMACNYYQWVFSDFLEKVLPYTIHLHVVDAKGVDGEGVQIGKGDVDFNILKNYLNQIVPNAQFIPEIWQGHKDRGEGFWYALEFLEEIGL